MNDGRTLGPWQLHELLGKGGNAEVYRATDDNGREVALKVIKTRRADKEPYQRFVKEIETLRTLTDTTGVLALVDSHLPDVPSKADRPWLAMPVATLLNEALEDEPLEVVVEAVATIATTLARLHDDRISHRDVKPSNLYQLGGQWLVGDFGLVATPEPSGLTPPGHPLGPAHYTAYEMIAHSDIADPKPADVYSLAKALWVLATGQNYPPEGHQPAGTRRFEVNDFRPHPNAHLLDALIDRATRIHPESRPLMAEVAAELHRWLKLTPPEAAIDISDIRARFRAKVEASLAEEDIAEQREEQAHAAIRRLAELVAPLNRALLDLHPRAVVDGSPDEFTRNVVQTRAYGGSRQITFRYQRLSHITLEDGGRDFSLRFARCVELDDGGNLILHFAMLVGPTRTMGGVRFQWMPDTWEAPVGSIEAEAMLRAAVREAAPQLKDALVAFVDGAP